MVGKFFLCTLCCGSLSVFRLREAIYFVFSFDNTGVKLCFVG